VQHFNSFGNGAVENQIMIEAGNQPRMDALQEGVRKFIF
jgi:hypothetical protein